MALDPPAGATRGALVLALGLAVALAGHAAWWSGLDASPGPFLSADAGDEKALVASTFPDATPPTVRVVVTPDDGNVLTPDALTGLASVVDAIASDGQVAPALDRNEGVASVLDALGPHLEGPPGTWNASSVDRAVDAAAATPEARRALTAFLDDDADLTGQGGQAAATAVVVRLAPGQAGEDPAPLQERIRAVAAEQAPDGLATATDAPALRDDAARSPWAAWTPLAALVAVPVAALVVGVRVRGVPAVGLAVLAGAGAGLLAGRLAGHATPLALGAAYAGAGLGAGLLVARRLADDEGPAWTWALPVLPVAALVGWAPAGLSALALVAAVAAVAPLAGAALHPDPLPTHPRAVLERLVPEDAGAPGVWGPAAAAALLLAGAALVGLPEEATGGWQGSLPTKTSQGSASHALEERFGAVGPGSQLAVAAWGPVDDPAFLRAVHETGTRLDELTLTRGQPPVTVLTLARDWATNGSDPRDAYDPAFAEAWANATDEDGVPTRNVTSLFETLRELDPDRTRSVLRQDPGARGTATLLRQQVRGLDRVPEPVAAVEAALQPLVAASDRVAEGGDALDDERAAGELLDTLGPLAAVLVLAGGVAGGLDHARRGAGWGRGLLVGAVGTAPGLAALLVLAPVGLPASPGTLIAAGLAGAAGIAAALPASWRTGDATGAAGPLARVGLPLGVLALAGALALATSPTPALADLGWAWAGGLLAGGALLALALPGLVGEARRAQPRVDEALEADAPAPAHADCTTCGRSTATAAERCASCGRWNLREACPAHPDALEASCRSCGAALEDPRFR